MCGIYAAISRAGEPPIPSLSLETRLRSRGPDFMGCTHVSLPGRDPSCRKVCLNFTSTVLSLRGDVVTEQPFKNNSASSAGPVFCWNGEAWKFHATPVGGNDGAAIFSALTEARRLGHGEDVLGVLRRIEGPFAFVYFDDSARMLYFGRDRLGRRSLLVRKDGDAITLSSISHDDDGSWSEVEADGIYALSLDQFSAGAYHDACVARYDWAPNCTDELAVLSLGIFNTRLLTSPPPAPLSLDSYPEPVWTLRRVLTDAVRLRVTDVPVPGRLCQEAVKTRVAVLFSGGLDCTVLARLTSEVLPADQGIDLVNVGFENPRIASRRTDAASAASDVYEACPDRITGRSSFAELQKTCPTRGWRFIAVNISYAETTEHRVEIVSLIRPHNTEMDLSIAYALYFASRGRGLGSSGTGEPQHVTTSARVLLSGLGADELFGGYMRHATAFSRRGYEGLLDELKLDVGRLGKRNLGRDDRVISNWGREARFPFLDEQVLRWAITCPVTDKCDFGNADAISGVEAGKRVLRLLALELGMHGVAREKKRAIQFGSRTAKMGSGRTKGTALIALV